MSNLLPESLWHRICRDLGIKPGHAVRLRLVRCWLCERITGSPGRLCEYAMDTREFRAKLADLPRTQYPELVSALDDAARRFLDDNGLEHEPLRWSPPEDAVSDWTNRRPLSSAIDVGRLHELVGPRDLLLSAVAARLDTSIELVREVLNDEPAPRPALTPTQAAIGGGVELEVHRRGHVRTNR